MAGHDMFHCKPAVNMNLPPLRQALSECGVREKPVSEERTYEDLGDPLY